MNEGANYVCPVCGYDDLDKAIEEHGTPSFTICSSCGFEFGYDDDVRGDTYESYRTRWIENGMKWWSKNESPPPNWDPVKHLLRVKTG